MLNHTTLIIIITVIVSLAAWQNKKLLNRLIFYPPAVDNGQWDRFVTHGFIHADSMHLLFNMFTLYFFGQAIEGLYRSFLFGYGFVVFYVLAIVVAMIPSYLKNKHNASYLSLGASGGVSAVLFAFILLAPWDRDFGMTFYDRDRAQIEAAHSYDDELMCNQMHRPLFSLWLR